MKLLIKTLVWTVVSFLLIALALFLPAGTVLWPAGWVFLILLLGFTLVNTGLLFASNPGLLQKRLSLSQPNQKTSDKVLTSVNALDRKSTRLNSSHPSISYAVFCLKK